MKKLSLSIMLLTAVAAVVTATILANQIIPVSSTRHAAQTNTEENKALVRSAIDEIFNQHDVSAVDKYVKEDLIQNNTGFPEGREARKQYFGMLFNAFPDLHVTIEKMLAEDDEVVVFLNWNGTHKGEFQGMPPTNNPITMKTAHIFRIEDGMIAEQWEIFDMLDLLAKTGIIAFGKQ